MRFSAYPLIITYLLASLGLGAVALTESIEPVFIAIIVPVVAISLILNIRERRIISSLLWNCLAALVLVLYLADYLFISRNLITASSRFLTILLGLKLFDLKTARDHVIAFAIVFFQILGAAASTISPAFFVLLAVFIIASIFAMIVFNIKKELHENGIERDSTALQRIFDMRFFLWITLVSVFSLAGGFLFFFMLPRMGAGFFERKTLSTVKVTGFAEHVDLGSMGPVKKDPTIIMRVELAKRYGPAGPPLRLRGTALDHYDGRAWSRRSAAGRLRKVSKGPDNTFYIQSPGPDAIEQLVVLEPLETEVIFAASHPGVITGKFDGLRVDEAGSLYLPATPFSRMEYTAWSSPRPVYEEAAFVNPRYSDVSGLGGPVAASRAVRLVKDITKGMDTDAEKAGAIEAYLKTAYAYTLDPKAGGGETALDDFLFYSRQGYCEHFATAMVMMLRLAGVNARIVTGFLPGEWNGLGNYYIVRQSDAHSWVEAFIRRGPRGAWVTFDPTPSAGTTAQFTRSELSLYLDLLKWRWTRYIVNYSLADQRRFAESFEANSASLMNHLRDALKTRSDKGMDARFAFYGAGLLALMALSYLLIMAARRKKTLASPKTPAFYVEMLGIMEHRGVKRAGSETPLEFALRVDISEVSYITRIFQDVRYGNAPLGRDESARLKESLGTLKKGVKRPAG